MQMESIERGVPTHQSKQNHKKLQRVTLNMVLTPQTLTSDSFQILNTWTTIKPGQKPLYKTS